MSFGKRLKNLRLGRHFTQQEFAEKTGVSVVTVRNWEHDSKKPSMDALISIAQALRVTIDTLVDSCSMEGHHKAIVLPYVEQILLDKYRQLDKYGKRTVDMVCSIELERVNAVRQSSPVNKPVSNVVEFNNILPRERFIPRYTTPAAAGSSAPLDGTNFEMILVDGSVPPQADYAVNIQGNSMYPYIEDGDMVYVQKDAELSIGDIGIWCVDGAMYCKQYYIDGKNNLTLVSANPDFKDTNVFISVDSDDSVKFFGKVLLGRKTMLPDYLLESGVL